MAGRVRTRTRNTEAEYRKRYASLCKRAAKALNLKGSEEVSVRDVAEWLAAFASQVSHSTYRQYRAAVHQALRDLWDAGAISLAEVERIAGRMLVTRAEDGPSPYAPRRPFRTSAGRTKGLAENTRAKLIEGAAERRRHSGQNLADYLTFGPKVGLRVYEWIGAQLDGATLTVACGKFSVENQRGIAATREQLLIWDAHELARLDEFLKRLRSDVAAANGRADLVMRRLGRLLRKIRKHAGAPRVSLRSVRHQFTANLRAAGYSREERAAALGHASADTSDQHYGKKNRGWRGMQRWIEIPEELTKRVRPGAKTKAKLARDLPLTRSDSLAGASQLCI